MKKIAAVILLLLIGFSANAAQEGDEEIRPLHYAVRSLQDAKVSHLLRKQKCDIEEKDIRGKTALFLALEGQFIDRARQLPADVQQYLQRVIVGLLIDYEASLDVVDKNNVSLRSLLEKEENAHINEMLQRQEEKYLVPRQYVEAGGIVIKKSAAIPVPLRAKKSKLREWYEYED